MTLDSITTNPSESPRYEILGEIARGRMGIVCQVMDHSLCREVACKVPNEQYFAEPGATQRFVDEVRITAILQHRGIPPVHDLGTLPDGRPFMILKLFNGRTLDALLKEQHDPTADHRRLLAAVEMVCQVVAYAHYRNVVHRDLEPANIIIDLFGDAHVLDWGLARASPEKRVGAVAAEDARLGAVYGNPAYMAPEQARGEATDFRTDVFGLGALLCHMLTGAPPFLGDSVTEVARTAANGQLDDAVSRLDKCRGDKELVALAMQCLQPLREERPSDASDVARRIAMTRPA